MDQSCSAPGSLGLYIYMEPLPIRSSIPCSRVHLSNLARAQNLADLQGHQQDYKFSSLNSLLLMSSIVIDMTDYKFAFRIEPEAGGVVRLVENLNSMYKAWVSSQNHVKQAC